MRRDELIVGFNLPFRKTGGLVFPANRFPDHIRRQAVARNAGKKVDEREGSYLFRGTDSLWIVVRKRLICDVRRSKGWSSRESGFKALSLRAIRAIADKFKTLNPYDPSLVSEILKIEDVNFEDSNPKKPFRQLYGYAISSKRYALYARWEATFKSKRQAGTGSVIYSRQRNDKKVRKKKRRRNG